MSRRHELRLFDDDSPAAEKYFASVRIGGGLGVVGVDRTGVLTGVELDGPTMVRMRPERVAEHLVEAINRVQGSARRRRAWP